MPVTIYGDRNAISISPTTLNLVANFLLKLEEAHLAADVVKMHDLYDPNICAIETNLAFQGRDNVLLGLKELFQIANFLSFQGELRFAGESGDLVWIYVLYKTTHLRVITTGEDWLAENIRCTYLLRKTDYGLKLVQNHCSEAVSYEA